jgi:hypothetical protein
MDIENQFIEIRRIVARMRRTALNVDRKAKRHFEKGLTVLPSLYVRHIRMMRRDVNLLKALPVVGLFCSLYYYDYEDYELGDSINAIFHTFGEIRHCADGIPDLHLSYTVDDVFRLTALWRVSS